MADGAPAQGGAVSNAPGLPGGGRSQPIADSTDVTQLTYEPTCSLNGPENGGALCNGALGACPTEGDIAYWVYRRSYSTATGAATPWVRIYDPPFVCRGATEPAPPTVPVEVLIGQELARDFASLGLPRATVDVRPQGRTLINIPTRFSTSVGTTTLPTFPLLGRQVTVTAIAETYDWDVGDGTRYPDVGAGSLAEPIEHTYDQAGRVGPTVTITWSGTFTVEGIAGTFPIVGTATTTGPPAELQVLQSRTQLVDKP